MTTMARSSQFQTQFDVYQKSRPSTNMRRSNSRTKTVV